MGWIEDRSIGLFCPCAADVFIRSEAAQGFEPPAEVVGRDEVGEVAAQLVVGFIVVALDVASSRVRFMRSTWPLVQG